MSAGKRIVIIGGNAAGPAAAAQARRIDPAAEIILFEEGEHLSTGTCELPYVLSGEVKSFNDIVFFTPETFQNKKGVIAHAKHRAERIDSKRKQVTVRNLTANEIYEQEYDTLILATGTSPAFHPLLLKKCVNVFGVKTVASTSLLDVYLSAHPKGTVLIIGSGYIGLETAEAMARRGYDVLVLEKAPAPFPAGEPEIQTLIFEQLQRHEISFFGNAGEPEYIFENERITRVKIEGRIIDVTAVIVSTGFTPNAALAVSSGISLGKSGAIAVDTRMRTSVQHIYAAGDAAEYTEFLTRKPIFFPLATLARESGYTAGENAAGGNAFYRTVLKNTAFRFFESIVTQTGLTLSEARTHGFKAESSLAAALNKVHVMPGSGTVFGKLVYEKDTLRILGASFFGREEAAAYADITAALIRNKICAKGLLEIDFNYSPPVSPFNNLLHLLAKQALRDYHRGLSRK